MPAIYKKPLSLGVRFSSYLFYTHEITGATHLKNTGHWVSISAYPPFDDTYWILRILFLIQNDSNCY